MREKGERGDGKETKGERRGKKGKEGGKGKGGILCSCDFLGDTLYCPSGRAVTKRWLHGWTLVSVPNVACSLSVNSVTITIGLMLGSHRPTRLDRTVLLRASRRRCARGISH